MIKHFQQKLKSVSRGLSVIWVSVGVSWGERQPRRHCACALHPHLRPHVEIARKNLTKMLNVAGGRSLVTGWKKDFGFFNFYFSGLDASRRTFNCKSVAWFSLVGARHGAEEIDLGHRASPPELRRRVGNSVDHGQRWARPRTDTRCRWSLKRAGVGRRRD